MKIRGYLFLKITKRLFKIKLSLGFLRTDKLILLFNQKIDMF